MKPSQFAFKLDLDECSSPIIAGLKCISFNGSGVCWICGGTGDNGGPQCGNCWGSGKCPRCGGTGVYMTLERNSISV